MLANGNLKCVPVSIKAGSRFSRTALNPQGKWRGSNWLLPLGLGRTTSNGQTMEVIALGKLKLWEQVRKCELFAQKLSLELKEVAKEIKQLEQSPDVSEKVSKS